MPQIVPPKVAISTIFHPEKEYAYKRFLAWAKSLEYGNLEFIIKVKGLILDLKYEEVMEQIRTEAIEADVIALLHVDISTIGPSDAIDEFLALPADMMTGIYFAKPNMRTAACWKDDDAGQEFLNAEVYTEIDGAGMGFCFMRRGVLEAINFNHPSYLEDMAWNQAKKAGFRLLSLNMMRCRRYFPEGETSHYEFGDSGETRVEEYVVNAPDGIIVNGKRYPFGKPVTDLKMIETIRKIDEPYRSGKIKQFRKTVSVVGKKQAGIAPTHTKTQTAGKVVNRIPSGKKEERKVGIWKRPPQ